MVKAINDNLIYSTLLEVKETIGNLVANIHGVEKRFENLEDRNSKQHTLIFEGLGTVKAEQQKFATVSNYLKEGFEKISEEIKELTGTMMLSKIEYKPFDKILEICKTRGGIIIIIGIFVLLFGLVFGKEIVVEILKQYQLSGQG